MILAIVSIQSYAAQCAKADVDSLLSDAKMATDFTTNAIAHASVKEYKQSLVEMSKADVYKKFVAKLAEDQSEDSMLRCLIVAKDFDSIDRISVAINKLNEASAILAQQTTKKRN